MRNNQIPPSQMPFAVGSQGDVYSIRAFNSSAPDKFVFEVVAGNPLATNDKTSIATVQVSLVNDTHRMVMVIPDLSPENLAEREDEIVR